MVGTAVYHVHLVDTKSCQKVDALNLPLLGSVMEEPAASGDKNAQSIP